MQGLVQLRRTIDVQLVWVPSHGKNAWWTAPLDCPFDTKSLRDFNQVADDAASEALRYAIRRRGMMAFLQAEKEASHWCARTLTYAADVAEKYSHWLRTVYSLTDGTAVTADDEEGLLIVGGASREFPFDCSIVRFP